MRKVLVLLMLVLIGSMVPIAVHAEDDTIYLDTQIVRKDLPDGVASELLQFSVANLSDAERTYSIELWNEYTTRDADELPLNEDWFTFKDSGVILPIGGRDVFHVEFNIPTRALDAKYRGWFKVYDTPQSQFKVITVIIRTGNAIPNFDFMIGGNTVFSVPVWGPRETQTTDKISFKIINKGSAASRYWVYPRAPDTYTLSGVVYSYIPESREWVAFKDEDFKAHPAYQLAAHPEVLIAKKNGTEPNNKLQSLVVSIDAYSEQTVVVPLSVPADAVNGKYTIFLQVSDIGPEDWEDGVGMGLNEAYAIKVFFDLAREGNPSRAGVIWPWITLGIVGGLLGLVVGLAGLKRIVRFARAHRQVKSRNGLRYGEGRSRAS